MRKLPENLEKFCRHTYYFILSGWNNSLSYSEAKALLQIYSIDVIKEHYIPRILIFCTKDNVSSLLHKIVWRAGLVKEAGTVIYATNNVKDLIDSLKYFVEHDRESSNIDSIWISIEDVFGLSTIDSKNLFNKLSSTLKDIVKIHPRSKNVYKVMVYNELFILGKPIAYRPSREFQKRKPSKRPFFRSIALPIDFSRALVNIARVREGEVLLDPFCGTGSIVIEAALMDIKTLCIDIDWELARGSYKNIRYYGLCSIVILGDSTKTLFRYVDGVATDPPYGRAASTHGEDIKKIYSSFLERMSLVLKPRRYMSFIAPHWLTNYVDEQLCRNGFIVVEKHYIYVHSSLTRVVYVVVSL